MFLVVILLLITTQSFAQETISYAAYLGRISNYRTDIRRATSCADFATVTDKLEAITAVTMPNGTVMQVQHEGAHQAIRRSCNQQDADRYLAGLCPNTRCQPGQVAPAPSESQNEINIDLPQFLTNPNDLNPPSLENDAPISLNDPDQGNNPNGNNGPGNNSTNDVDNDGIPDLEDALPNDPTESRDSDGDGIGNNADPDDDNDGTPDSEDELPFNPTENRDTDGDGTGNNADLDDDNDGIPDSEDDQPLNPSENSDTDGDGVNDNNDLDDDNDGIPDLEDALPFNPTENRDTDGDGIGNNSDLDDDNDGTPDLEDALPLDPTETRDSDGDGIADNADLDDDNDGIPDAEDAQPLTPSENSDTDNDGIKNDTDLDDDNDGTPDLEDALPFNPTETTDTDNDGIGNNADSDDDNDGIPDLEDALPLDPSENGDNSTTDEDRNESAEEDDSETTPSPNILEKIIEKIEGLPQRTLLIIGIITVMLLLAIGIMIIVFWPTKDTPEEAPQKREQPTTTAKQELAAGRKKVQEGDYRQAVRKLFLAVLITLHERGVIQYDTTLTNREIIRHAILRPSLIKPLMPIIATYERVWYGFEPLQTNEYDHLVQQIEQLQTTSKNNPTQPVKSDED